MHERKGNDGDNGFLPWPRCRPHRSLPVFTALVLAITFLRPPGRTLLFGELLNSGHSLLFAVLALLALCSYRAVATARAHHPLRAYLVAGMACLLVGCAVEGIQALSGGDADAYDVLRDLAGILVALCACAAFDPRLVHPHRKLPRLALAGCALALAGAGSWPLASLGWAYHQRALAFPVLADPAASWSAPFLRLNHARLDRPDDMTACSTSAAATDLTMLRLAAVRYAGISIIEPQPDWRTREALVLELYSAESAPVDLSLRIHDVEHDQASTDRFNRPLTLQPGPNRFRIPLAEVRDAPAGRPMDLARIAGVMLFVPDATGPVSFCMGPVRLE